MALPAAPTNIRITDVSNPFLWSVEFGWNAVTADPPVTRYEILIRTGTSSRTRRGRSTTTNYTVTGLNAATQNLRVDIRAVNSEGVGPYTTFQTSRRVDELTVTPPATPPPAVETIRIKAVNEDTPEAGKVTVIFDWDAVTADPEVTGYSVVYTAKDGNTRSRTDAVSTTSREASTVFDDGTEDIGIEVIAVNDDGDSPVKELITEGNVEDLDLPIPFGPIYSGRAIRVGSIEDADGTAITGIQDLAWDGTTLFAITNDTLYSIDRDTSVATRIGIAHQFGVNADEANGLTWDGTTLLMISDTYFYSISRTTGIATLIRAGSNNLVDRNGRLVSSDGGFQSHLAWDGTTLYTIGLRKDVPHVEGFRSLYSLRRTDASPTYINGLFGDPSGLVWNGVTLIYINSGKLRTVERVNPRGIDLLNARPSFTTSVTSLAWDGETIYGTDGDTLYTLEELVRAVPTAPTLTTAVTSTTANAFWETIDAFPDVTRYEARIKLASDAEYPEWANTGIALRFTFSSLDPETDYDIQVRGVNDEGEGAITTARVTTNPPGMIPGAPTGLSATPAATSIALTWDTLVANPEVTRYEIRIKLSTSDMWAAWVSRGRAVSGAFTNLSPNTMWDIELRGVNDLGEGPAASIQAMTLMMQTTMDPLVPPGQTIPPPDPSVVPPVGPSIPSVSGSLDFSPTQGATIPLETGDRFIAAAANDTHIYILVENNRRNFIRVMTVALTRNVSADFEVVAAFFYTDIFLIGTDAIGLMGSTEDLLSILRIYQLTGAGPEIIEPIVRTRFNGDIRARNNLQTGFHDPASNRYIFATSRQQLAALFILLERGFYPLTIGEDILGTGISLQGANTAPTKGAASRSSFYLMDAGPPIQAFVYSKQLAFIEIQTLEHVLNLGETPLDLAFSRGQLLVFTATRIYYYGPIPITTATTDVLPARQLFREYSFYENFAVASPGGTIEVRVYNARAIQQSDISLVELPGTLSLEQRFSLVEVIPEWTIPKAAIGDKIFTYFSTTAPTRVPDTALTIVGIFKVADSYRQVFICER